MIEKTMTIGELLEQYPDKADIFSFYLLLNAV